MGEYNKGQKMTTVVEKITPEIAKKYLEMSKGNRSISRATVDAYARDMRRGKWSLNGEPISFDEDGYFKDGHHRLYACIEANSPFWTNVVRGADRDAVYDQNRVRSLRDQFKIDGEDTALCDFLLLATIRRHLLVKKGISKATGSEVKEFYHRNDEALARAFAIARQGSSLMRKAPVVYAVFCASVCGVHTDVLNRFCEVCAYGTLRDASETSALKLREYLLTRPINTKRGALEVQYATETAIRDFNDRVVRKRGYSTKEKPVYSNQRIIELL